MESGWNPDGKSGGTRWEPSRYPVGTIILTRLPSRFPSQSIITMVYKPLLAAFLAASVANVDSRRLILGRDEALVKVETKQLEKSTKLTGLERAAWNAENKPESVDDAVSVLSEETIDDDVAPAPARRRLLGDDDDAESVVSVESLESTESFESAESTESVESAESTESVDDVLRRRLLRMTDIANLKQTGAGLEY